jgi:hypothetical protein
MILEDENKLWSSSKLFYWTALISWYL